MKLFKFTLLAVLALAASSAHAQQGDPYSQAVANALAGMPNAPTTGLTGALLRQHQKQGGYGAPVAMPYPQPYQQQGYAPQPGYAPQGYAQQPYIPTAPINNMRGAAAAMKNGDSMDKVQGGLEIMNSFLGMAGGSGGAAPQR